MSNFPPPQPAPAKSNTKKYVLIGLGCLGLIVVAVVAAVAVIGVTYYRAMSSPAAKAAQAFVESNETVKTELGEPLTTHVIATNVNETNGAGSATVGVLASGSKGTTAGVEVELTSSANDDWQVTRAELSGGSSGKNIKLK